MSVSEARLRRLPGLARLLVEIDDDAELVLVDEINRQAADIVLDDNITASQERDARTVGQAACPGQWDAHLDLTEAACPSCGAAL